MSRIGESGQALLETVLLGLLFLVPLIWLLGLLAAVHSGALAATAAAREAGLDAARSSSMTEANRAIDDAVQRAFVDQGLDPELVRVRWDASSLRRGTLVEIRLSYPVSALQMPFLGSVAGPSIWVNARHIARVDPYRSRLP